MKQFACVTLSMLVSLPLLSGCGEATNSKAIAATPTTTVEIDGSNFLLSEEPTGAVGVIAARESA